MTDNTIIVTRDLAPGDAERLRQKLRELWPGEDWTIMRGQVMRETKPTGPAEWKGEGDETMTATPVPRYEG